MSASRAVVFVSWRHAAKLQRALLHQMRMLAAHFSFLGFFEIQLQRLLIILDF